jgi:hypothetical protein
MTIPKLSFTELKEFLEKNDFEIISNQDWDVHNRVMIGSKNGQSFPLQIKDAYFYPFVLRLCKDLEIDPPAEHLEVSEQYKAYKREKKAREQNKEEEKGE